MGAATEHQPLMEMVASAQSPCSSPRNSSDLDQKGMEEQDDYSVKSQPQPDVSNVTGSPEALQSRAESAGSGSQRRYQYPSRTPTPSDVPEVEIEIDYDVILIHGVRDHRVHVWDDDDGSDWVQSKLLPKINCRVIIFGYDVTDDAPIFSEDGIKTAATELLKLLKELRTDTPALLMASRTPAQYHYIFQMTKIMFFFNHPHRNRSTIGAHDIMIKLLNNAGPYGPAPITGLAAKAGRLADQIETTNHESVDALFWQQIAAMEVISLAPKLETKERDPRANMSYIPGMNVGRLQQPFEEFYYTYTSHADLGSMDSWHSDMVGLGSFVGDYISRQVEEESSSRRVRKRPQWRSLLSNCPPVRAPLTINTHGINSDNPLWLWLKERDTFKHWYDASSNATEILYIHASSRPEVWADSVVHALDSTRAWDRPTLSFRFDRHDARFNSIHQMLSYFIVQLLRRLTVHDRVYADEFISFHARAGSFSTLDLIQGFRGLCEQSVWQMPIFAISCVNECHDDVSWFLRDIKERGEGIETRIRLVVISDISEEWMVGLKGYSTVELDEFIIPDGYQVDGRITLQEQVLTALPSMGPGTATLLRTAIAACGSDLGLKGMILSWAASLPDRLYMPQELEEKLKALCNPSTATVCAAIHVSLPPKLRELEKEVFQVVQTAFHPLSIEQIAWALCASQRGSTEQLSHTHGVLKTMIARILPGLYELKHGEVHSCALSESAAVDAASHHQRMATICLDFLILPEIQESIGMFVEGCLDHKTHPAYWRHHFIEYSILYLAKHYTSAGHDRPKERLLDFFQRAEYRSAWYDAHYALSNPISRGHKLLDPSILPIVARTGIPDVTQMALEYERGRKGFKEEDFKVEVSNALVEAARQGHLENVKLLLGEVDEDTPGLADAVSAAAAFGVLEPLQTLINHFRRWQSFKWPKELLHRASWLGFDTVVKTLLEVGHTAKLNDRVKSFPYFSPLMICMHGRHDKVARLLVESGEAEVDWKSPGGRTALDHAAHWGDGQIIRYLLQNGANKDVDLQGGWRPISTACMWGNFKTTEALLEAQVEIAWTPADLTDGMANRPLIVAASEGYHRCVESILSKSDSDPDIRNTALRTAVEKDELEVARILLQHGADPNIATDEIKLPLLTAVEDKNMAMVKLLIGHNADVEMEDHTEASSKTVLISAAAAETSELVELLLDAAANPNHICEGSKSPLLSAVFGGNKESVRLLLEKGADVGVVVDGTDNWAPVNAAYDDPEILKMLLEAGADINHRSDDGTVLFQATRWGFEDTVEMILGYAVKADLELALVDEDDPDKDGMTPLCIACKHGRASIVRLLLEAGANAMHQTPSGSFPLGILIQFAHMQKGHKLALQALLEYRARADLQQYDNQGNTALHYTQPYTPVPVIRALVNMGAELDAVNRLGMTPLLAAVREGNVDVCKYLLSKKASLGSPRDGAPSGLRLACKGNSDELIRLLVEAGADVNEVDKITGESPLYAYLSSALEPTTQTVEYLVEECGADVNFAGGELKYPIIQACLDLDYEIARSLMKGGADINARDDAGRAPIHFVHANEHIDIKDLVMLGADINARDKLGRSAVHYAAALGDETAVEYLLDESDIQVNDEDNDGWTPLMWACQQRRSFNFEYVVDSLLSRGADVSIRGRVEDEAWSPLKLARFHGKYPAGVLEKLEPKNGWESNLTESEDVPESLTSNFHESGLGWRGPLTICDGCLCECRGVRWQCAEELDQGLFYLCFRCFPHRDVLHSHHAQFTPVGERYDPELEPSENSDSGSVESYQSES